MIESRFSSVLWRQNPQTYDPVLIARIAEIEALQPEAEELRKLIDRTVTSIPKPAIALRVARALDDEWNVSPERGAELAMQDPEPDWRDVPKKTEAYQEYFTFSDAEGWRFYLPAFMCHYLSEFPDYGYDAVYDACRSKKRIKALTDEELAVVDKFLEFGNSHEDHWW